MSGTRVRLCDQHGAKLEVIPNVHHRLAVQERNQAVDANNCWFTERCIHNTWPLEIVWELPKDTHLCTVFRILHYCHFGGFRLTAQ